MSGDVAIARSGEIKDGFSTWTAFTAGGVTECMVSAVTSAGTDAAAILDTIDGHIQAAGGTGLKADGVFNNAYVLAGADQPAARARIADFNTAFTGWYGEVPRPGRTAQFMGGIQNQAACCGCSSRAMFVAGGGQARL
eukprot:SAG22_NODE_858_length_6831_cov_25.965538_2_plen_138_part_00